MGQYYRPVTKIDGELTVYNRDVDGHYTLAKLTEHSWWENDMVNAVVKNLYRKKGHLAWVGDYAEDEETPVPMKYIWGDQSDAVEVLSTDFRLDGKYLVNYTQNLYVDLDEYKQKSQDKGWILSPLPLLTAIGNGRGGGDYRGEACADKVGTWAWDLISIEDEAPEGFVKMDLEFKDE